MNFGISYKTMSTPKAMGKKKSENLLDLTAAQVQELNVQIPIEKLINNKRDTKGIF